MGPVSLIGFTFHHAHGRKRDRQLDLNGGAFSGARAVGGDIAAVRGNERRGDPQTEARAFGGGDVSPAAYTPGTHVPPNSSVRT